MNYATNTFLLVCSSVRSKQLLCFVRGQDPEENKNIQQRTFFIIIIIFTPFVKQIYINRDNRKNVEWRRAHYSKD